jgi:hypothetical protein
MKKLGVLPWHCRAMASVRLGGEKAPVHPSTLKQGDHQIF